MKFKTLGELVASVYNELALVSGSSVQTYTEPTVKEYIQNSFDHIFEKRFWDHLTSTTYHTLDGVGGVITDAVVGVAGAEDIKWIRKEPYTKSDKIPYFRDGVFNTDLLAFTAIPYGDVGYSTKIVKFNPVDSAENIAIRARRRPDDFVQDEDVVPMDRLLIKHLTAALLLGVDGMNPGAQADQQSLFDDRYDTLVSNEADEPIQAVNSRFDSEFTVAE